MYLPSCLLEWLTWRSTFNACVMVMTAASASRVTTGDNGQGPPPDPCTCTLRSSNIHIKTQRTIDWLPSLEASTVNSEHPNRLVTVIRKRLR
ncbi:hypothetical protein M432DRAFT_450300 [Thermoascus aurantiacus ATCC 26904]